MDIERLREAGRNLEFIASVNPNWSHGRNSGLNDDATEILADKAFDVVNRGIHELIDFYVSRQSVKSEEVQEPTTRKGRIVEPVAIPKMETTSGLCWYCDGIEDSKVVSVKNVVDEFGRELPAYETPYNFCPNCGRKLD